MTFGRFTNLCAALAGLASASACQDLCTNTIKAEPLAPSGQLQAVIFERECGATTSSSVHVSIEPAPGHTPSGAGNVFTADTNHKDIALHVTATWLSPKALRIEYDPRLRTFRREDRVGEVNITYLPRQSNP